MFEVIHNPISAWMVLGFSICLTVFAYLITVHIVNDRNQSKFNAQTTDIARAIEDRMLVYEQVLWSGVGLMYASNQVTRQEWKTFVSSLKIAEHWPGIQGLGFSIALKPDELEKHVKHIREEGFADYQVYPTGSRAQYTPVIFVEPFDWRNRRALGYDAWSNELRRSAMIRARDQGIAATSGIITLVQETSQDAQKGFLTYVPVYQTSDSLNTEQQRQKQIKGWIYAAFRVQDLMSGILGSNSMDINFDIYDGEYIKQDQLLFQSHPDNTLVGNTPPTKTAFESLVRLPIQGRTWTIHFYEPYSSADNTGENLPTFILAAGIIIDLMLFYIIISLHILSRNTEKTIHNRTTELKKQMIELQEERSHQAKTIELLEKAMTENKEESTKREMRLIQLKQEVNELLSQLDLPNRYDNYS